MATRRPISVEKIRATEATLPVSGQNQRERRQSAKLASAASRAKAKPKKKSVPALETPVKKIPGHIDELA